MLLQEVPPQYTKTVLVNYYRGYVAPQVIDYILKHEGFTIPTLSYIIGVSYQTIEHILKRLSPWVIQTKVKIDHPNRGPGNRPNVWIKDGVDLLDGVNEARRSYYDTLTKYDPALKAHQGVVDAFLETMTKDREDIELREILTYLVDNGVSGPERHEIAQIIAVKLHEEGFKVWRAE